MLGFENKRYREMAKKKAKMGFEEKAFKAKYGNQPVTAVVDGKRIEFRSKLEYRWAQHLDFYKTCGIIKDWFYEFHTFRFEGREKPPTEYTPDFLVRNNDNTFEYFETKGLLQKFDIDKLKIMNERRPYVKITYVFWISPKISVQKKMKLERYCHRIIWDARSILEKEPIDMV